MSKSTIIAVAGKGGVGKTSLSATIVRCLTEKYPDKKILAIDADPAVGLSTALGIDVKMTIDDIRKEIIASVDEGHHISMTNSLMIHDTTRHTVCISTNLSMHTRSKASTLHL